MYMTAQVPSSEIGTASAGMNVADAERRNRKITRITRQTAISRVSSTSLTAWRIEDRAVHHHVHRHRGRYLRPQCRQFRPHGVDHGNRVGVRLFLDRQHDGALAVQPGRDLVVFDAVVDLGDLVELDRRTVAPGHHDLAVVDRLVHLARRPEARHPASGRSACPPASTSWRARPRPGYPRATARAPPRLPDRPARGWRISARRRS